MQSIIVQFLLLGSWLFVAGPTNGFDLTNVDAFYSRWRTRNVIRRTTTARPTTSYSRPTRSPRRGVTLDRSKCFPQPDCPSIFNHNFVSLDGTCNNRVDRNKGRAHRSYKRLIPADYADKTGFPRRGKNNEDLPSTRLISSTMSGSVTDPSSVSSQMVPWWGQYIVHDIAKTPVTETNYDGTSVDCDCSDPSQECFNIEIPNSDVQRREEGKTCFPLKRSFPVADASSDCDTSVRQQLNDISGYIDLGTIYGSSEAHLNTLLDPESNYGLLKEQKRGYSRRKSGLLPLQSEVNATIGDLMECPAIHRPVGVPCYVSGDFRANENSGLIAQHTLWMRQHNRVASALHQLNPSWSGGLIFKTTRSIVTALEQIVTYDHFLPAVLGARHMKRFGLNLVRSGYWYGYDSTYDATVTNAFSAAAFRFGHSLISSPLSRPDPSWHRSQGPSLQLKSSFFNSEPILDQNTGGPNSIIRGLLKEPANNFDSTFTDDLRNFLFAERGRFGLDLLALNIQRGRDHGIPSYTAFRRFCGLKVADDFDELTDMTPENRKKLYSLYNDVDDIDLYVGGVAELPVEDGIIGPTFACIISYQFRDIRKGDRFWHENGGIFQYFTRDQLAALREASFPRLICDAMADMESIQPYPMRLQSTGDNARRPCSTYQALDLTPWQDGAPVRYHADGRENEEEAASWSAWFPSSTRSGQELTAAETLHYILRHRPDEVCNQVLDTQDRTVRGSKQVRFQCSPGTIKYSDFPPVESDNLYWTDWIDNFSPASSTMDDSEQRVPKQSGCLKPFAIQAQTVEGIPAGETDEVFEEFSPVMGLICKGDHQESGRCSDYRVRYLCRRGDDFSSTETDTRRTSVYWTSWVSADTADNYGDLEFIAKHRGTPGMCRTPIGIEARTVEGKIPAARTGDRISKIRADYGFACYNSEQRSRRCRDYEVRYKCTVSSAVPYLVQRQKSQLCRAYGVCC